MAKAMAARQTAQPRRADPQRRAARPAQRGAISARAGIDRLQRALGNCGMYHLLRSGAIQAKLAVGPADDEYEREADRVADDVVRMPELASGLTAQRTTLRVQRVCPECEEEELQRASVTQAPSGGGAEGMCPPLPDPDGDWAKEKWLCEMRQEPWGSNARLLAPGAKGRSVELLHQVMHQWLCWISPTKIPEHTLPNPESDLYTEATGLVVKDFQKLSHAVMQEGIVGPETISLLDGYVGGPDIPPADCGIPEPKPDAGCGPECYDQSGKALPEAELPETCSLLCPDRSTPPRELPFVYSRLLQVGGMFANHAYVDVPRINKRYSIIEPFCSWWDGEEWQEPGVYTKAYGGVPAQKYDNSPDPCGQPTRRSKCEPYDSVEETEQCLEATFQAYPSPSYYEAVSGPNSNTFAKWLAWNCCKNFEAFYHKPPAHFHTLPGWGSGPAQAWPGDTACPSEPTCGNP